MSPTEALGISKLFYKVLTYPRSRCSDIARTCGRAPASVAALVSTKYILYPKLFFVVIFSPVSRGPRKHIALRVYFIEPVIVRRGDILT